MTAGAGFPAGPVERSNLRAADTDRDRAVEFINTAYMEGRLSKDEHEVRLAHAMSASTYADLDQLVHDLPAAHAPDVTLAANTNGLALASLGCGVGQLMFGPLATIPAVVLGHVAR
ncbi:MAG: DUF1707 and DUF4190 domain-containing protein, partial [Actinobacteria bacterium]|nr:DUF1707 and DUF4190 domain-containing protein [Actinomycetota bacterium]